MDISTYKDVELEAKVASASPHGLVQLLFDELNIQLKRAQALWELGDNSQFNQTLEKATNILSYLHQIIVESDDSELPHNLSLLYEYMMRQLLASRVRNQVTPVAEVLSLIEPIRTSWREISNT